MAPPQASPPYIPSPSALHICTLTYTCLDVQKDAWTESESESHTHTHTLPLSSYTVDTHPGYKEGNAHRQTHTHTHTHTCTHTSTHICKHKHTHTNRILIASIKCYIFVIIQCDYVFTSFLIDRATKSGFEFIFNVICQTHKHTHTNTDPVH